MPSAPQEERDRGYPDGRYYDPATSQFLSVDPLVDVTGQPYGYANEDPANESDPGGLGPQLTECTGTSPAPPNETQTQACQNEEKAVWGFVPQHSSGAWLNHVILGGSLCMGVCLDLQTQGGHATLSWGFGGWIGVGPDAGYAVHRPAVSPVRKRS